MNHLSTVQAHPEGEQRRGWLPPFACDVPMSREGTRDIQSQVNKNTQKMLKRIVSVRFWAVVAAILDYVSQKRLTTLSCQTGPHTLTLISWGEHGQGQRIHVVLNTKCLHLLGVFLGLTPPLQDFGLAFFQLRGNGGHLRTSEWRRKIDGSSERASLRYR